MGPPEAEPAAADGLRPPPTPTWPEVVASLSLGDGAPIADRYRALFHARQVAPSLGDAVELLAKVFPAQTASVLLRHELCYVLGQIGEPAAVAFLRQVLHDEAEDEIVRHEAAEALAAIGTGDGDALDWSSLADELEAVATGTSYEPLRETCELAVIGLRKHGEGKLERPICVCQYTSKDPMEGLLGATEKDVPAAAEALADSSRPLGERYEGMFTLRNVGGEAAAAALAAALLEDTSSAVLRHEVAFVLGQMEADSATRALVTSLGTPAEHGMVRHEAAISLGKVGTPEAEAALRDFQRDPDLLVAESCVVALATAAYWRAWEALEERIAAGS